MTIKTKFKHDLKRLDKHMEDNDTEAYMILTVNKNSWSYFYVTDFDKNPYSLTYFMDLMLHELKTETVNAISRHPSDLGDSIDTLPKGKLN